MGTAQIELTMCPHQANHAQRAISDQHDIADAKKPTAANRKNHPRCAILQDETPHGRGPTQRLLESHSAQTTQRLLAPDRYLSAHVNRSGELISTSAGLCRASHQGDFFEAQAPHDGHHFDLSVDGSPVAP
jgi:hypothetical protein